MSERIKVKPAREGLKVRITPEGRHIAADGELVTMTPWLQRRLYKGDLVKVADSTPKTSGKEGAK